MYFLSPVFENFDEIADVLKLVVLVDVVRRQIGLFLYFFYII